MLLLSNTGFDASLQTALPLFHRLHLVLNGETSNYMILVQCCRTSLLHTIQPGLTSIYLTVPRTQMLRSRKSTCTQALRQYEIWTSRHHAATLHAQYIEASPVLILHLRGTTTSAPNSHPLPIFSTLLSPLPSAILPRLQSHSPQCLD